MTARSKSKKLNKAWLHDHLTDPYVKQAQREGYRARAAYKLKEIDEQLHLLEPGQVVVDLGAVPGAWSQYVRRKFGRGASSDPAAQAGPLHGTIIALDMLEFEPIDGVDFIAGDFREPEVLAPARGSGRRPAGRRRPLGHGAEPVGQSLPPMPHGWPTWSSSRSISPRRHLRPNGTLVCKVFHGSGYSQLVERFKASFRSVKPIKPKASRAKSAETFLVGIGLKPAASGVDNPA